ncbi:MAG: hypothetical protein ACHQAX_01065 [Gammaproteobacteria bacterium]
MNIQELISALDAGTFSPDRIDDRFVFLQLYQGRTLLEHIADRHDDPSLLYETLCRYETLSRELTTIYISHREILHQYFFFFCGKMAAIDQDDKATYFNETLPTLYDRWFNAHIKNQIIAELPDYFEFLKETHPVFPYCAETPLLHRLRYLCICKEIGKTIENNETLESIIDDDMVNIKLTTMANHPLYATPQNPAWINSIITDVNQRISNLIGYTLPLTQTHTSYQLSSYANVLATVNRKSYAGLSDHDKLSSIELLSILYMEGSDALQADIASHIDALIQNDSQDLLLQRILLITLAPPPLGRALPRFRANGPELLSRLGTHTVMLLLDAIPSLLTKQEDKIQFLNKSQAIRESNDEIYIKFDYEDAFSTYLNARLMRGSMWLAYVLAHGDIPTVHAMTIISNHLESNDRRCMLSLMGSHKLILGCLNYAFHASAIISDRDYYQVFSPREPQFRINTRDDSYFSNNGTYILKSLQHGIRHLRFHAEKYVYDTIRLNQYTEALINDGDQLYYQFTDSADSVCPPYDLVITKNAVTPGHLSLASRYSMERYAVALAHYAARLNWEIKDAKFKIPFISNTENIEAYCNAVQYLMEHSSDTDEYAWIIVGHQGFQGELGTLYPAFRYDLYVYKNRIEFGPLSKLKLGTRTQANINLPNKEISREPGSLFLMAAKSFLSPMTPDEIKIKGAHKIPQDRAEDIEEIKRFGVTRDQNRFRLK